MIETTFIKKDVVIFLHDGSIKQHGGTPGIRDNGLLEGALARPVNRWNYESNDGVDLFDLAAAYAFGITKAHAFYDGNKRTAWVTAATFLALNNVDVEPSVSEAIVQMVSLTKGSLTESGFAEWLRLLRQASSKYYLESSPTILP